MRFREFGGKSISESNAAVFEVIGAALVKISTSEEVASQEGDCYHVGNGISNIFTRNRGGCVRVGVWFNSVLKDVSLSSGSCSSAGSYIVAVPMTNLCY